jgi:hypothetical protein
MALIERSKISCASLPSPVELAVYSTAKFTRERCVCRCSEPSRISLIDTTHSITCSALLTDRVATTTLALFSVLAFPTVGGSTLSMSMTTFELSSSRSSFDTTPSMSWIGYRSKNGRGSSASAVMNRVWTPVDSRRNPELLEMAFLVFNIRWLVPGVFRLRPVNCPECVVDVLRALNVSGLTFIAGDRGVLSEVSRFATGAAGVRGASEFSACDVCLDGGPPLDV